MRMAVEQGMYTDMRSLHLPEQDVERCREIWWTVYVLDRQMTAMMGVPMSLSDDDITAPLPSFGGSGKKQLAMGLHVKLAKANAVILQSKSRSLSGYCGTDILLQRYMVRLAGAASGFWPA